MTRRESATSRDILSYLANAGPSSSYEIARELGMAPRGVTQCCNALLKRGQVQVATFSVPNPYRLQRPARVWQLNQPFPPPPATTRRAASWRKPAAGTGLTPEDNRWMQEQQQRAAERAARAAIGARL